MKHNRISTKRVAFGNVGGAMTADHSEFSRPREAGELFTLLYDELRRLARAKLARETPNQTLQATALVHEAYLRLAGASDKPWKSRRYFFAAAAEAMRRILIDAARRKQSARRGGGLEHVELEQVELPAPITPDELVALDAALDQLAQHDPDKAELVKLKFFAGLSTVEAAKLLNISEATAKRSWAFSRAWLFRHMKKAGVLGSATV